jgi:hypothetical protein
MLTRLQISLKPSVMWARRHPAVSSEYSHIWTLLHPLQNLLSSHFKRQWIGRTKQRPVTACCQLVSGLTLTNSTTLIPEIIIPWSRLLLENHTVRSASQEIPRILWNQNVYYRVHKSPPPVAIPCQMNQIHIPKPYFPKTHFNIILSSTPRSCEWSLPCRLPNQILYAFFTSPCALHFAPISSSSISSP